MARPECTLFELLEEGTIKTQLRRELWRTLGRRSLVLLLGSGSRLTTVGRMARRWSRGSFHRPGIVINIIFLSILHLLGLPNLANPLFPYSTRPRLGENFSTGLFIFFFLLIQRSSLYSLDANSFSIIYVTYIFP